MKTLQQYSNITTGQTWQDSGVMLKANVLCISLFCQLYFLVLSTVFLGFVNYISWFCQLYFLVLSTEKPEALAALLHVKLVLQADVLILNVFDKPSSPSTNFTIDANTLEIQIQ